MPLDFDRPAKRAMHVSRRAGHLPQVLLLSHTQLHTVLVRESALERRSPMKAAYQLYNQGKDSRRRFS